MILKMQSSENWSVWCGFLHQQSSRLWWCFGVSLLSCPAQALPSSGASQENQEGFSSLSTLANAALHPGGKVGHRAPLPQYHRDTGRAKHRGDKALGGNVPPGGGVRARVVLCLCRCCTEQNLPGLCDCNSRLAAQGSSSPQGFIFVEKADRHTSTMPSPVHSLGTPSLTNHF